MSPAARLQILTDLLHPIDDEGNELGPLISIEEAIKLLNILKADEGK